MLAEPPRPTVPQQLDRVWRWSLWDYSDGTKLAKVIIGVPPHRYTNRDEARRALGYQHRADAAGHMYARAGIAISVSPSDAERLAPWLSGIEVFVDPGLDDLPIVLPASTNGVVPPPTNGQPQSPSDMIWIPNAARTRARGFRLPTNLLNALDRHAAQSKQCPQQVVEELLRRFLQV